MTRNVLSLEEAKRKFRDALAARFEGKRTTAVATVTSVERDTVSGHTTGKVRATIDGVADQSVFIGAGTGVAVGESLRVENRAGGIGPEWVSLGKTGSVAGSEGDVDTGRPLSTPSNLVLSSSTYASGTSVAARITVQLDQIGDWEAAANYEIAYYRDADGEANQHVSNAPHVNGQSAVQYAILSLLPGTSYSVKVRAVGYGGSLSSWTAIESITTATDASIPTVPTGFGASQVSDTALRFYWARIPDADFAYYEIGVSSTSGAGGLIGGSVTTGDTPEHIHNVTPATNRWFRVRAIDTSGNASAWSSFSGPHATVETVTGSIVIGDLINQSYGLGLAGSPSKIIIDLATASGLAFEGGTGNLLITPDRLLSIADNAVGITAGATYQFIGTGSGTAAGWRNISELAGNGLTAATGVLAVSVKEGVEIDADAVRVDEDYAFTWAAGHTFQADIQLDADLDFVGAQSITTTTGNLTISPAGDVVFDPTGNDILPSVGYDLNIGSLSKKYLTLHAAELWVETLVAQNTIATIGGRILVGPTTTLTRDLADGAGDTTIYVKHNEMASGDRAYMEAQGKVEFFAITSGPTEITPLVEYSYTVTRDLDTSGRNLWYAGDAMFNTGTTGNGFIDIYSVQSMKPGVTQAGPSIVGNVRNSATYNDWSEHWAIGNLNGLYGYGVDTYGAAFGKYASGQPWISVDATNGFRIMNYTTTVGQWSTNGDWQITGNGENYIGWDSSEGKLTVEGTIAVSQSEGAGGGGANLEGGGLITVSDYGMIQMGTNSVFDMGASSSFTAAAGSTFTIGTQGTGAYLSYVDGVLDIEGMLTVTDGADFLPIEYRPVAISASFETNFVSGTTWNLWGALPYGDDGGYVAGRMETANGNVYTLLTADTVDSAGSRYIKIAVRKTRLAGDFSVGSIAYPNTIYIPGTSCVTCNNFTDAEWTALSEAERNNRVVIADAYLTADFSDVVSVSFRSESGLSIITPDFIRTPNLSSLSADLGSVTAGSIVVGSTNKLWLNDDATAATVALAIGGSTKATAPFLVYEDGDFHAGGSAANYLDWNGTTLTVKGTIQADAGQINGNLTVESSGNLRMNGGKIQWQNDSGTYRSYIDNTKIVISEASGYSTTSIGDTSQDGLIDVDMFNTAQGAWDYGIHITDGGNSLPNVSALYHGQTAIGANAVDRIFNASAVDNGGSLNTADGFHALIEGGTWNNFSSNGVAFKGQTDFAPAVVARRNETSGYAPAVWAQSMSATGATYSAVIGASNQTAFYVDNTLGGTGIVALNAGSGGVEYVRYQRFINLTTSTPGAGDAGVPTAVDTGEFIIYARGNALRMKNSQYEWTFSAGSATAL